MKIKLLSLFMSLTMLLSTAVACAPKEETPENTDEKVEYEGIVITEEYKVIRAESADKATVKSAVYLRDQINELASLNVELGTDFIKRGEEAPTKEILVGKTNRELQFDRTTLKEGEYFVGIEGERIIIDAYDSETLHFAVEEFAKKWLSKDLGIQKDGALLMNDQICQTLNGVDIGMAGNSLLILSQNLRSGNDGNGNDIVDRQPRFQQLVQKYSPDIIGTQETTKSWYNYITSGWFSKVYGVVGCSRNGRNATTGEWNTIHYKLDRFELLDSDTIWLSDTPSTPSKVSTSSLNRICTWALLKDKQTGQTILMANTHLDHTSDQARVDQSKILLNYLARLNKNDYPMYITGDYNFVPTSEAYRIINKQLLDAHDEALVDKSTTQYTFHSYGNPSKEIDFCFFNDKSTAVTYYIINENFGGYVSDHYGVITKFIFK